MTLRTQIDIDAPPERVWTVLTDFERFPEWNPFIRELRGTPREGTPLHVRMSPPEGREMTFKPTVTAAEPNRSFSWWGTLLGSWIFAGVHQFRLEDLGEGRPRLHHDEDFSGLLVPFLRKSLDTNTRAGFEQMNEALKAKAEKKKAAA